VRWWRYENIMEGIQESGWAYGLEAAQPKDMMGNEAWLRIKFKDSQVEFSGYEWSQIVGALMQGIVDLSEPDVTHGWTEFY
jgi:hypothetical protein